jgi:hypothetical protein
VGIGWEILAAGLVLGPEPDRCAGRDVGAVAAGLVLGPEGCAFADFVAGVAAAAGLVGTPGFAVCLPDGG